MKIKMHKSFSYAPFSSNRKYNERKCSAHTKGTLELTNKKKKTEEEEKL